MTFVLTDLGDLRPGLNACLAVRYLLEKAGSTAQALDLLAELPLSSNCCLLLADAAGDLAVAECAPARRVIRQSDTAVCAVNRFQTPALRSLDAAQGDDYYAAERYHVVMDTLPRLRGDPVRETQRLLRGEYGFLSQYDGTPDFETGGSSVWSTVFDLPAHTVLRAAGDPRFLPFRRDRRLV